MLLDTKTMLQNAQKNGYAVAAFNVYSLETVQAAIAAAEATGSPVIIALGERYVPTVDIDGFAEMVKGLARKSSVPVSLHLDHAYEKETIIRAIRAGFNSVMYDGSKHNLENNIRYTKEIVEIAHLAGVSVEAEIGSMARGAFSDEEEGTGSLTDPKLAEEFVKATGVDFLAAAIGTVHGMYQGEPNIDLELLQDIRKRVDIPLVLHGGSGTPHETILKTINSGICKINVNTEVSIAAVNHLKNLLANEDTMHLSVVMEAIQSEIQPVMEGFINLFANNK
ncbi:fructose-bisphosphate aldolase [Terribacillus saccharophilus]|uniref:class II fructose-bisphosphate aldolase n=1 Tax=Terribacillus saccharophilus TaxID=361277 RepID=UPI000BA4EED8|nr:class II fructose-bisphosphate aldolase [Terribacillus saccharophilus]PAF23063.1 fructose-bisphosphate aldolase [Terribacillus saccharophilus]PAF36747.1 fructose-bisphosphate aldolase [Terribacillus saccharophilus]